MSRLAGELDRGKIKCRRFGLFRKKPKKQVTEDERYISRCIISIELEHSNNHWQRSSIEREKNMENSNIHRSTDRERNPIWLLSHYITLFVINYNFVKSEEKEDFYQQTGRKEEFLEKKRKRNKKVAEWDARELFRIKDDLIF
jgi:hypothetical protein